MDTDSSVVKKGFKAEYLFMERPDPTGNIALRSVRHGTNDAVQGKFIEIQKNLKKGDHRVVLLFYSKINLRVSLKLKEHYRTTN